jgi:hypothetical protein
LNVYNDVLHRLLIQHAGDGQHHRSGRITRRVTSPYSMPEILQLFEQVPIISFATVSGGAIKG